MYNNILDYILTSSLYLSHTPLTLLNDYVGHFIYAIVCYDCHNTSTPTWENIYILKTVMGNLLYKSVANSKLLYHGNMSCIHEIKKSYHVAKLVAL